MSFKDIWHTQRQGMEGLASSGVIGMHMVSGPIVGVAIGFLLDKWLDTGPWMKLIFLGIGIGAGFLNVYVDTKGLVNKLDKEAASRPASSQNVSAETKRKADAWRDDEED